MVLFHGKSHRDKNPFQNVSVTLQDLIVTSVMHREDNVNANQMLLVEDVTAVHLVHMASVLKDVWVSLW